MDVLSQVEALPSRPGVYLFKDQKGEILYIGKAKDLRKRVRSYFQGAKDPKTSAMLSKVKVVEHIVTANEKEALILEDALVKEHKPRYNIKLRDDKNYPLLRLDPKERYPRLTVVRRPKDDGALYYGPFPSAQSLKETLKVLNRVFPLRKCPDSQFSHRSRPCINYQMGRCLGPCCNPVDPEAYRELVEQVRRFLEGEGDEVVRELEERMHREAEALRFEEAAVLRDRIQALRKVLERQKIVSMDRHDKDVLALARGDSRVRFFLLSVRGGKLLGGRAFEFRDSGLPDQEILLEFLSRYYGGVRVVGEVIVPFALEDTSLPEALGMDVHPPRDRREEELLEMAYENLQSRGPEDRTQWLEELRRKFRLERYPERIEAFDLSNIGGREAVGSMVVFLHGMPYKDGYRRFRIKEVEGIDDYAMLEEVLRRRLRRAREEGVCPDLMVIDGGKGHLRVALRVLKEMGLEGIHCLSIAKDREGRGEDRVYLPGARDPIPLREGRGWALLLKAIRDEAHRFAISYHRRLRAREAMGPPLKIPGLGPKRTLALLERFGGPEGLREAKYEDLLALPGFGPKLAQRVWEYLRKEG